MVCQRCWAGLRRCLGDVPELLAVLADMRRPLAAARCDKVMVAGGGAVAPAPLRADVIDATRDLCKTLEAWAWWAVDGVVREPRGELPLVSPGVARWSAECHAAAILGELGRICNSRDAAGLCEAVLGPAAPGFWTVAKALARWPLEDRAAWAVEPCPWCDKKTVRVRPPRFAGDVTACRCEDPQCGWAADDSLRPEVVGAFVA
jgi:hypothetical protein